MRGQAVDMPGRYSAAIAIMQEMSWSWSELCAAPFDLVEEIAWRMDRRQHWQAERAKIDEAKARVNRGR